MNRKTTVIIADDHPLIRTALQFLLSASEEFQVVAEAKNGREAIEKATNQPADILLLDVIMPDRQVMEVVTTIQYLNPCMKIVMVSAHYDPLVFQTLVNAGIAGYLLKDEASDVLIPMLRAVMNGEFWFSEHLHHLLSTAPQDTTLWNLTDREIDILEALGQGLSNSEIALKLNLVAQTVRNYTSRIYEKLAVESRAQAIIWLATHGLPTKPSVLFAHQQGSFEGIYRD